MRITTANETSKVSLLHAAQASRRVCETDPGGGGGGGGGAQKKENWCDGGARD